MKLRDIDLRWSGDDNGPESFWKRGPVEYMFHRELRALNIDTPAFGKINVYCEPKPQPYAGYVHDGVTAVEVKCAWPRIEKLPAPKFVGAVSELLTEGTLTALRWFKIKAPGVAEIAAELQAGKAWEPVALGKKAVFSADRRHSARLSIRSAENLEYAVVSAAISRGRTVLGELPVCTTFPVLDYAVENFESLEWAADGALVATFAVYGVKDMRVFGRPNYDAPEFSHVSCKDSKDRRLRTFTIKLTSLLGS